MTNYTLQQMNIGDSNNTELNQIVNNLLEIIDSIED